MATREEVPGPNKIIELEHEHRPLIQGYGIKPIRLTEHIRYLLLRLGPYILPKPQKLLAHIAHNHPKLPLLLTLQMPSRRQMPIMQISLHPQQHPLEELKVFGPTGRLELFY